MKNNKKTAIIAIVLVMAIAVMGFGFATWQTTLIATGTVQTNASWDVEFVACDVSYKSNADWDGTPDDISTDDSPNDTLNLGTIEISQPGGFVVLDVTVENKGSIDAKLSDLDLVATGVPTSGYEVTVADGFVEGETLAHGEKCTFSVLVKADEEISEEDFYALSVASTLPTGFTPGGAKNITLSLVYDPITTNSSYSTVHTHA